MTTASDLTAARPPLRVELRRTAANLAVVTATIAVLAALLWVVGGVELVSSALKSDIKKPTNFELLDSAADTIRGNILYFIVLVLPIAVAFAAACIFVGARMGQDLIGKIIGGLVLVVVISPALVA